MTAPRWRLLDPALHWYAREGEPEFVAFSPKSGSVHLLTPSVRPLLDAMATRPLELAEIEVFLSATGSSEVAAVIESLDEAGLIEPAP